MMLMYPGKVVNVVLFKKICYLYVIRIVDCSVMNL